MMDLETEQFEGLNLIDNFLFLQFLLSWKIDLNEDQLKYRLMLIYRSFHHKIKALSFQLESLRTTLNQQKFKYFIQIQLWECFSNLIKIIKNKTTLKQFKIYIEEFVRSIENNEFYEIDLFESFINQFELQIELSQKNLKKYITNL